MAPRLASLFQDHAVLQRGRALPVWGRAEPGAVLRIALGEHVAIAAAGASGDFLARLPPLPAGGPHALEVRVVATGERVVVRDILIGEVWLASGQSNMEWALERSRPLVDEDIAAAELPGLRFFNVERRAHLGPQREVGGSWRVVTPDSAGSFSAVAFASARRLHRELKVPVGVIVSAWGGTFIQAWMSRSALAHNPDTAGELARFEADGWSEERWARAQARGPNAGAFPRDPGNLGVDRAWHRPEFDDSGWASIELPKTWQAAGHGYSGVFWFRRQVRIPEAWIGRDLRLEIGAADKHDVSYVEGVEVGRTGKDIEDRHWNKPRAYRVPGSSVRGSVLTVAVRVYSFIFDGGLIGPAEAMRLSPAEGGAAISLAGSWRFAREHDLGLVLPRGEPGHGERNTPHILFDNMIRPLAPFALRGALWYQGETNAEEPETYAGMLRNLVCDWRREWGQPDLAFHLVQLPNHRPPQAHQPGSKWARIREAQAEVATTLGAGLVVTIDVGDADDVHPLDKIPVGERLAQAALVLTYGRDEMPVGPIAIKFEREGAAMRCRFRHAEFGLATGDGVAPRCFFLAGEDRSFRPAEARIEHDTVVVMHPKVPCPAAVRYAWADNPEGANLTGRTGIPASPFRSDRW